jgi:ribonuclease P protein component
MNKKENKANKIKTRFIVTKKIGTAVIRNRIKRLFREILRIIDIFDSKEIEIIIIAKKNIKDIKFWELSTEFNQILRKV